MKRFLTFLVIITVACTGVAFAQTTGLESILSDVTQGLFGNELDAALTVQETGNKPDFTGLDANYLFGGLGNLNLLGNVDSIDNTQTSPGPPPTYGGIEPDDLLWLGMYKAEKPWSLFIGSFVQGTGDETIKEVSESISTEPGTVPGQSWQWIDGREVYEGNGRLVDRLVKQDQFLMPFLGMNMGIGLRLDFENSTDPGSLAGAPALGDNTPAGFDSGNQGRSYTYVYTEFENTAAANTKPSTKEDRSRTVTVRDYNGTEIDARLSVPMFLGGDGEGTLIVPWINYGLTLDSYSLEESYAAPGSTGWTGVTEDTVDIKDRSTTISLGGTYEMTRPGFGEHEDNELSLTAMPRFTIGLGTYSGSYSSANRDYAPNGGTVTTNSTAETTIEAKVSPLLGAGIGLSAQPSFYFDPAPIVRLGIAPRFSLSFSWDPDTYATGSEFTQTTKVTNAAGTVIADDTTSVTVAEGGIDDTGAFVSITRTTELEAGIALPMGMTITPENLPFDILMGATVEMDATVQWQKTGQSSGSTTTSDNLAGSSAIAETIGAATDEVTRNIALDLSAGHDFGVSFPFSENVRLDARLSWNLFNLNDMRIQAIVALP